MKLLFTQPDKLVEGPKILFEILGIPFTDTAASGFFVTFTFLFFFAYLTKQMEMKPGKKQVLAEMFYYVAEYIGGLALGDKVKRFVYFIATLFFYLILANIIGFFPIPWFDLANQTLTITPFLRPPTSDLNGTVALALLAIGYITYQSIKVNGFKEYLKGFLEPLPFLLPLNIIGELAKPFSLAMRLFGNVFSGMLIMSLVYKYLPVILPSFFHLYFDLFAGLIQSIIFVALTTVYLSFAV